jgi:hypothetical protein
VIIESPLRSGGAMNFLKDIWDTEGPLGIPMKDKQALQLEALLSEKLAEVPYWNQSSICSPGIC